MIHPIGDIHELAEELRAEALECEAGAVKDEWQADQIAAQVSASLLRVPSPQDAAPLKQQIAEAQAINTRVEQQRDRARRAMELLEKKRVASMLTDEIEMIDAEKQRLVEAAGLPVPGLGFTEDGVTFKGFPFDQASGAEQLRVSVAIAMAANPTLRVLRIKDGSLLDPSSLEIVADMLREHDYQLWIERVDVSGKVGIVMQDGEALPDPFEDDAREEFAQSLGAFDGGRLG